MLLAKAEPPLEAVYHCIPVPVADKSATVAVLQKVCELVPVGAAGILIVAVTSNLVELSQVPIVWLAK